jgi:hypothetical protein
MKWQVDTRRSALTDVTQKGSAPSLSACRRQRLWPRSVAEALEHKRPVTDIGRVIMPFLSWHINENGGLYSKFILRYEIFDGGDSHL